MQLARVTGTVVASVKADGLEGVKLLIVQPLTRQLEPEGNPVVVHVVRRDTVSVPAGRFAALLLRPEITTSGVFSKNGRAELWLADDSTRVVLQLKTKLGFGAISLYLRRIGPEP